MAVDRVDGLTQGLASRLQRPQSMRMSGALSHQLRRRACVYCGMEATVADRDGAAADDTPQGFRRNARHAFTMLLDRVAGTSVRALSRQLR